MAEGFFRHYLGDMGLHKAAENVRSAGIETHGVNPKAIKVMAEAGIDIAHHTSDLLGLYLNSGFDYVITVCDNAARNCPVFPGNAIRLYWPFDDPAKAAGDTDVVMAEFRRVRDDIGRQVRGWLRALE
jgi:arsenate reductase